MAITADDFKVIEQVNEKIGRGETLEAHEEELAKYFGLPWANVISEPTIRELLEPL